MTSIVLGQYDGEKLKYKGHVILEVGGAAFAKIKALADSLEQKSE